MAEGRNNAGILEFRNGQPITKGRVIVSSDPSDRSISMHSVPVVTPNCDIVVASLTLRIEPGMPVQAQPSRLLEAVCRFFSRRTGI